MNFLPENERNRLLGDVSDLGLMPGTAYILREAQASGYYGTHDGNVGTAGTVSVRVDRLQRSSSDGIIADAEVGRTFYQLTMPYDTDLRDGDDVRVNTVNYQVLQVSRQQTNQLFVRAIAAVIDE